MRRNSWVSMAVIGLAFCCFSSATNFAPGCQAPDEGQQAIEPEFKFYMLKYLTAYDAKELIDQAIHGLGRANVTADVRVNSLVVVADAQMQQLVGKLIKNLDVAPREPVVNDPPTQSKLLPLRGLDVDSVLAAVRSSPVNGRVDIQVQEPLGLAILTGKPVDVSKVQEMIADVVAMSERRKVTSANLSMTFIVDAVQQKDAAQYRAPNAQVASVIEKAMEAGLIAIEDPRVVCKTVNRVRVRQPFPQRRQGQQQVAIQQGAPAFENQSESGGDGFAMSGSGYIAQLSGDSFELDAQIELSVNSRLTENRLRGSTQLHTKMELPLGHPVLLSFSTILGIDSVVIVQVDKAD